MENHQENRKVKSSFQEIHYHAAPQSGTTVYTQVAAHWLAREEKTQANKKPGKAGVRKWFNRDENDGIDFIL